jgi:hypothetical protein
MTLMMIRVLAALALCCSVAAPVFAQSAATVAVAPSIAQPELSANAPRRAESPRTAEQPCTLGEFCVGPLVTLGAIDPLGIGAHLRYGRYLGFAIDYQFLPTHIDIGVASSTWSLFTVEGRVYPFGNAFFVAGGIGYQRLTASAHQVTPAGDVGLSGSLGMPSLKLGIGLMGHDGFVLGADIGFNLLLGDPNVEFGKPTGPGASYQTGTLALREDVNEIADRGVRTFPVIPQLNLIRMGYLF